MTDDEKILEWLGYKPCTCGQECGGMYLNGLYYQPLPIDLNLMFEVVIPSLEYFVGVYINQTLYKDPNKRWKVELCNAGFENNPTAYGETALDALKAAVVKMIQEQK